MQYTQIQQTAFFPLLFHLFSVRTVLKGRTLLLLQLQCREKRTELRGWEAKGCRGRDGNDLSTASSFQPSVPQQLREERRMKVRRDGRRRRAATREHLSRRPIFRRAVRNLYHKSLRQRCEAKLGLRVEKLF